MEINFKNGWVHIPIDQGILILTRQEFIEALKRGKAHKCREAMAQRLAAKRMEQEGTR